MAIDESTGRQVICLKCGYDLRGLDVTGVCPECGTPIERSLHGNLLRYSDGSYLAALHRGVVVILSVIALQVCVFIGMLLLAGVVLTGSSAIVSLQSFEIAVSVLMTGLSLVLLYGWWLFSSPDPAYVGRDVGGKSRVVVRVALVIRALTTPLDAFVDTGAPMAAPGALMGALEILAGVTLIAAWALMFFASMLYIRWLAPRLPNAHVDKRAKLLMWLGPLLWIIGCGIGGIVALVLYWNLLNRIRLDIRHIRDVEGVEVAP